MQGTFPRPATHPNLENVDAETTSNVSWTIPDGVGRAEPRRTTAAALAPIDCSTPGGAGRGLGSVHDVGLQAQHEADDLTLLGRRHFELRQCRGGMPQEHGPVLLSDAHTTVAQGHVPAAVVHGSARAGAE